MKKFLVWILLASLSSLLAGCLQIYVNPNPQAPDRPVTIITVVVTAAPLPTGSPPGTAEPIAIATAPRIPPPRTPSATPTPLPSDTLYPRGKQIPTPIPDYVPGGGMAVLVGASPFELAILPGGWQAYQIGPSANEWGYLVDVTPLGLAPEGAYVESKILPEYFAGRWVDVLWLRAPGIQDALPVSLDLIATRGWDVTYENYTRLTPGEWTGWGMFDNAEGCGGVLDISPDPADQAGRGAYIQNTRVQPEFPGNWLQVIRVQLSNQAAGQNAWLRYYAPGSLGVEQLRQKATLSPGSWNGFVLGPSSTRQGFVVEVMPQKKSDNEVAFAVVRPESNGETWEDVLRVYVPQGRPPLEALLRVLAVKAAGPFN